MENIGLYLHIPFCSSKCPYCDFYSFRSDREFISRYVDKMNAEIIKKSGEINCKADTLYIGGGTPSLLGFSQIAQLVSTAKSRFLTRDSEITLECNPYGVTEEFFNKISECGVNRISLGLQSANDEERRKLGRRAGCEDVKRAIYYAQKSGIENISLDVMLGIPESTLDSLEKTLEFCVSRGVPHISCYMLKIEENTPFFKMRERLNLPDDDAVADMYLFACEYLESHGIKQYEISNFSVEGRESRHNLKYWRCEEYLGIGASAHSFLNGKRFYCKNDAEGFVKEPRYVFDGDGGSFEEFAMLKLRLTEGVLESEVKERFGFKIPEKLRLGAEKFIDLGLVCADENSLRLTRKGFLLSNSILAEIL